MQVIADLHMHSKYSRATSPKMNLEELSKYAKTKGLSLLGTGDCLHPVWAKELKSKLANDNGNGIYDFDGMKFLLTTEVSLIYTQDMKGRRVHHILLIPDFNVLSQVIDYFGKKGRLDYDGRPIFGFSSIEMAESLMEISREIEIIPAHCLLPDEVLHCNPSMKKISEIKENDKVLTHTGNWKKVEKVFSREFSGKAFGIRPYYFNIGIKVTPEHPFFAIKSGGRKIYNKVSRKKDFYKNKKPAWICAKDLKNGDILLYPRNNKIIKKEDLDITEYLNKGTFKIKGDKVIPLGNKIKPVNRIVKIDKDFCRLLGYYLAEGYFVKKENSVRFCFSQKEKEEIEDVRLLMQKVFGIELAKLRKRHNSVEMIFFSKILVDFFSNFCYDGEYKAPNKQLPFWMLEISPEKQAEILYGWFVSDAGYTTSRVLMNQMKVICLRLGILPSIYEDSIEKIEKRGKHKIGDRIITAKNKLFALNRLSFFEDKFNLLDRKPFKRFKSKEIRRHGWIDNDYVYIPINRIETFEYNGRVFNLHVEDDNSYVTEFATVHNCWTPWFSIFGSMSGFDSVEECFGDKAKYIHALETGLSSNPLMNWRISSLDNYMLVSFSDSHSAYPHRLGREATVFEFSDLTYKNIINAIRRRSIASTIEVDPSYGKYHYDGHRKCRFSCPPAESRRLKNICPKCHSKLIIGVLNRVEELADRPEDYIPENAIPYKSVLPLTEIISFCLGSAVFSKKVYEVFNLLIDRFGNEFNVMLNVPAEELKKVTTEKIADIIIRNREASIRVKPGYDGEYGVPIMEKEKSLADFGK